MASLLLFSVNTYVAWYISRRYYGGRHYVWCSETFSGDDLPAPTLRPPPSSTPRDIYESLRKATAAGDWGDLKIRANREGIIRGAHQRLIQGIINETQLAEIGSLIDQLRPQDFKPLLYILPRLLVEGRLHPVPIEKRAHPLSEEFTIEDLESREFEVIEF